MPASLKDFQIEGPTWAAGCDACEFGILVAPQVIGMLPLYEQRAVANAEGLIVFCECRAAYMYRQYLRKLYNAMEMESRKNIREFLLDAMPAPTLHYEGEAS